MHGKPKAACHFQKYHAMIAVKTRIKSIPPDSIYYPPDEIYGGQYCYTGFPWIIPDSVLSSRRPGLIPFCPGKARDRRMRR